MNTVQRLIHNTPRETTNGSENNKTDDAEEDQDDKLHYRKPQQQLFNNVENFFKYGGHKGEEEFMQIDEDDSMNLTENALNQNDNSGLFKKSFKRKQSPLNPQRSVMGVRGSECIQSDVNQNNLDESLIQEKLASYSYNGCGINSDSHNHSSKSNNFSIQHNSVHFQNHSALHHNTKVMSNNNNNINDNINDNNTNPIPKSDEKESEEQLSPALSINKYIRKKVRVQNPDQPSINRMNGIHYNVMKVPYNPEFTKSTAKKRMTEIIKNNILEYNSSRTLNDFEKGNKIIQKVIKNSMDRMQRIEFQFKGFIYKVLNSSQVRNHAHLTNEAKLLIKDKSYIYKQRQKQHHKIIILLNRLIKKSKQWSFFKVFMPTTSYRLLWDAIQVFFTVLFLYFYSILVFFGQDYNHKSEILSYYFTFALYLFLIDMLVHFNTAFFNKDAIVLDRKLIAQKYIKSEFFTDALSIIMLSLKLLFYDSHITYNPNHDTISYIKNILVFFKIFGLKQKSHMLESVSALKDSQKHLLRLFTQIILVVLAAHIVSILWYGLALIENEQKFEITWISKANIQHSEWHHKYIYSLYWSVTTMTTVGYGDISATNEIEALFVCIVMIFMSCVFAYSINNIGIILQAIERDTQELTDNVTTIQRYLNRKCVNVQLKSRIRHYLYFLAAEQKDRNKDVEDKVLNKLSNKLRDEVKKEVNSRILKKYMIFTKQFSRETINRIVPLMKEVLISPNEIIFKENEVDDCSVYFLENGIVEIQHTYEGLEQTTVVVKTLTQNQLFGEISLFSGLARTATARSVNLSTLYKITRAELIDVLKHNQEDYERFMMINELIVFQKDYSYIGLECYTCHKYGHTASKCQLTHLQKDHQFIALRHNFSSFQVRKDALRNKKIKSRFVKIRKGQYEKMKKKIFPDMEEEEEASSQDCTQTCENMDNESYDSSNSEESSSRNINRTNMSNIIEDVVLDTSINFMKSKTNNEQDFPSEQQFKQQNSMRKQVSRKRIASRMGSDLCRDEDIPTSPIQQQQQQYKIVEDKPSHKISKKKYSKLEIAVQNIEIKLNQFEEVISSSLDIQSYRPSSQNRKFSEKYDPYYQEKSLTYQNSFCKDDLNLNSSQLYGQILSDNNNDIIGPAISAVDSIKYMRKDKKQHTSTFGARHASLLHEQQQQQQQQQQLQQTVPVDKEDSKKNIITRDKDLPFSTLQLDQKPSNIFSAQLIQSQQQIQNINNNQIDKSFLPNNHNNLQSLQPYSTNMIQTATYKQFEKDNMIDIMEQFDCQKEYSKFFPQNNISKVLEKVKIQINNMKKNKIKTPFSKIQRGTEIKGKAVRRLQLFVADDQVMNLSENLRPSTISYGIGQKGLNRLYPLRKN